MKIALHLLVFIGYLLILSSCNGQTKTNSPTASSPVENKHTIVGGGCDGCELMYVDMPTVIRSVDTSTAWNEKGQRLVAKGTVYQQDGKTVAPGIIIYYWQTDNTGHYTPREIQSSRSRIHGHIRGWVKTDEQGRYAIYTIRPAPYPGLNSPAHIHFSVKEPNIADEYYIDDIVFEDDSLVNAEYRNKMTNRAGNGISKIKMTTSLQLVERDIILGMNIPNYPTGND